MANSLYVLVIGIAVLAGVGAGFGAAMTMYASVQARTAEIGTLRALGFSKRSILVAFLIESVALALLSVAFGAWLSIVLAVVVNAGLGVISLGAQTFSANVITWRVSPT